MKGLMNGSTENRQRQLMVAEKVEGKTVGAPKPLWQIPGKRAVSLQQWLEIYEKIPVYHFQEVTAPLSTVKHSHKRLVKLGLIKEGEYAIRIRGSKKKQDYRIFIIRLPPDPEERRRILKDIDRQKSLSWLRARGKI
jgi:hypothetical protein